MDNARKNDSTEKYFGQCIINWKIENYCVATCKEDWSIESPEFRTRGPRSTTWKMTLNSASKIKNVPHVTLTIERSDSDEVPDTVWANWKVSLIDSKESAYYVVEGKHFYEGKSSCCFDLETEECILSKLYPFDEDILLIRCESVLYHLDTARKFGKGTGFGLRSLTQDLKVLHRRGKHRDIVLRIGDKVIRAHRAILYSRNCRLADMIDKEPGNVIELFGVDYGSMEKIVQYLYTGDLEVVLGRPSISLYECAKNLNIDELKSHYAPDVLILHSTVDVQEFVFLWFVTDFNSRDEDCISSPDLNEDISDISLKLHIYPKGVGTDVKHIAIFAEISKHAGPFEFCLEFALMDANRSFYCMDRVREYTEDGRIMLGIKDFAEMDYLENSSLLADDTLRIVCKLRILKGAYTSSLGSRMMPIITSKTEDEAYVSLATDIGFMFETGKFYDLVLIADGQPLRVHKCILSARSRVLSSMIKKLKENESRLSIPNVKPDILRILISYLYSGVLKSSLAKDVYRVYEAAETFAIFPLILICSRVLVNCLDLASVCDTLGFANARTDFGLKMSALRFIRLNAQEVYNEPSWETLMTTNPALCEEVVAFVNKNTGGANL